MSEIDLAKNFESLKRDHRKLQHRIAILEKVVELACKDNDECPLASYDYCPFKDEKIFDGEGICEHFKKVTEWKCWREYYIQQAESELKEADDENTTS